MEAVLRDRTSTMELFLYLVLMLEMCRCSNRTLEQKTVTFGEAVSLTCSAKETGVLIWMRLDSGRLPEIFGQNNGGYNYRFKTRKEKKDFILEIKKATIEDSSVYFCVKFSRDYATFQKGVDLKVQMKAFPTSDRVPSENVSTLLPSPSPHPHEDKYRHNDTSDSHRVSQWECANCYIKDFYSDLQKYSCVTCGEMHFRNTSRNETQAVKEFKDSTTEKTVRSLLCGALTLSLIVIAVLIYTVFKLKRILKNYGAFVQQTILTEDEAKQMDQDQPLYCTVFFTPRKDCTPTPESDDPADKIIYSDVRAEAER